MADGDSPQQNGRSGATVRSIIANEVLVDDFAEIGAAGQLASPADSDGDPEALRQAISLFPQASERQSNC